MKKNVIVKIGSYLTNNRFFMNFFGHIYILLKSSENKMRYKRYREKYKIHPTFRFYGHDTVILGGGKVILGGNSHINSNGFIVAESGCKVIIGKNCHIGHNVKIYTASPITDQDFSKEPIKIKKGDVIIEDNCFISSNVFITENVRIGKNSVIGAGAVITKNIPPFSLAVGVPAKVIKKLSVKVI